MTPLNEQAYNYLQKLIMENHFSYQEVYSETKLSKELGISRTPLRDAVHRHAQEGYIDIIPSKGFMLHQMNRKDVNETFQVRSALETYCTVQICKEFSSRKAKKLFKDLDWIMECMKDIMETTHSIKEFSALFCCTIYYNCFNCFVFKWCEINIFKYFCNILNYKWVS